MSKKKIEYNIDRIASEDFVNYAMYVDTDRAIPDVRDNLKPVHRRILYAMWKGKYIASKPFVKSARAVGDVIGLYHPHGDTSIYEAKVRLAQPWKMRYPLIEMHGNKGSLDGDSAAAMRYTETRLSKLGMFMVEELSQNSVLMKPNYDNSTFEPVYMPSMFPNILANGSMGIGVGMSSSILPHNLGAVVNAINAYLRNPEITTKSILKQLKGPDFPGGGTIINTSSLLQIYEEGKGTIRVRSKYSIETIKGCDIITFTELPYLASLDKIKTKIINLYNLGEFDELETILRDDTESLAINFQIKLKKGANRQKALKILFEKCGLETTTQMNNMILKDGIPMRLSIKELIQEYVKHRHQIITKIAENQLVDAAKRVHIVDGLLIAMQDIDGVISIIKGSANRAVASQRLMEGYKLTDIQATAILDMKLGRLTSLETTKLTDEKNSLEEILIELKTIIENKEVRVKIISEQLGVIKKKFSDKRRTMLDTIDDIDEVIEEEIIILLHNHNEITVLPFSELSTTGKGTRGKVLSEFEIHQILICKTTDTISMVSENGEIFNFKGYLLEQEKKQDLTNLVGAISSKIVKLFVINPEDFNKNNFLVTVTKKGIVKKSKIDLYTNLKQGTQIAKIRAGDSLIDLFVGNDEFNVMLIADGKILKIPFSDFTSASRVTMGVKGTNNKEVAAVTFAHNDSKIFSYTSGGKGKLSEASKFNKTSRAVSGYKTDIKGFVTIARRQPIVVLGEKNRAILVDSNQITLKNPEANGSKIYNGEIKLVSSSYQKF